MDYNNSLFRARLFPRMKNPRAGTARLFEIALWVMAGIYALNFLVLAFLIGPFDYDHLSGYYELAWRFWATGGGIPQFDPYLCGGRTLGGDPQLPIYSPLVLLVPVLGPTVLIKWEIAAQLFAGTVGLWRWLARLGLDRERRLWATLLYVSGGGVAAKFLVGHVTLGFYLLYPLFFHLSYRLAETPGKESHRLRVAYWVLFIYSGLYKPNFLIYGAPPLFLEAAIRAWLTRRPRVLVELCVALGACGLVNAMSLLPAWKYFHDFPRTDGSAPQLVAPYSFFASLLLPLKAIPKAFYGPGFLQRHEYSIFLGPVAVGCAWPGFRRLLAAPATRATAISLAVFLVFSAWIGLGCPSYDLSVFFPYTWLHKVWPGFQSIRVPTRFWYGVYLALIVFAGAGLPRLDSRGKRWAFFALGALPVVASGAINVFKPTLQAKETQWTAPRRYPRDIVAVVNEPENQYRYLRQGESIIDCTDNIEVYKPKELHAGSLLSPLLAADESISFDGSELFSAQWRGWNRIAVSSVAAGPYTATLNLNHSAYWRFHGIGSIASDRGGRLALRSFRDRIEGELVYEQPLVREGLYLTLGASWIVLAYLLYTILSAGRGRAVLNKGPTSDTITG